MFRFNMLRHSLSQFCNKSTVLTSPVPSKPISCHFGIDQKFQFKIFIPISSSTLHGHASVGVDHAGSVIVATVAVLTVVVRFVGVGVVQGNSIGLGLLLLHGGVGHLLGLVVGDGVVHHGGHGGGHGDRGHGDRVTGFRFHGDNFLNVVVFFLVVGLLGCSDGRGGAGTLWWGDRVSLLWLSGWGRAGDFGRLTFRFGVTGGIVLGESFHAEIFSNGQEAVELLLGDVDLSHVHEVEHTEQLLVLDPLQVEEGVLVGVAPEHVPEEWGACGQDDLVSLDLGIITGESHIKEVFFLPQFTEGNTDISLEIIPAETEFLRRPHIEAKNSLKNTRNDSSSYFFVKNSPDFSKFLTGASCLPVGITYCLHFVAVQAVSNFKVLEIFQIFQEQQI